MFHMAHMTSGVRNDDCNMWLFYIKGLELIVDKKKGRVRFLFFFLNYLTSFIDFIQIYILMLVLSITEMTTFLTILILFDWFENNCVFYVRNSFYFFRFNYFYLVSVIYCLKEYISVFTLIAIVPVFNIIQFRFRSFKLKLIN